MGNDNGKIRAEKVVDARCTPPPPLSSASLCMSKSREHLGTEVLVSAGRRPIECKNIRSSVLETPCSSSRVCTGKIVFAQIRLRVPFRSSIISALLLLKYFVIEEPETPHRMCCFRLFLSAPLPTTVVVLSILKTAKRVKTKFFNTFYIADPYTIVSRLDSCTRRTNT